MSIRNKRILITAGPTWVPIDSVRVISNIATGETGILFARSAVSRGAKVTLLLGPIGTYHSVSKACVIRFTFFNELKNLLKEQLRKHRYDIIIHAAAISDFRPEIGVKGKLDSCKPYCLSLVPLEKLVSLVRSRARKAILVMFKLEENISDRMLVKRARCYQGVIGSQIVIANRLKPRYKAFIIDGSDKQLVVHTKELLVHNVLHMLARF